MPKLNLADYTFEGLYYPVGGAEPDPGRCPSLCYLIGLTDSPTHKISDILVAKRILSWLYDCEEQSVSAEHLRAGEKFFDRYFTGGYKPQTPCMVVNQWSPISAMLERGFEPQILNRDPGWRSVATGIWKATTADAVEIESAETGEDLFWAIIGKVSARAVERRMWLSIIAKPGWDYGTAVNSLPPWLEAEVEEADRVLWKRTPDG
jgi:hypothetical protein